MRTLMTSMCLLVTALAVAGCASAPPSGDGAPPVVSQLLARTSHSWDGSALPEYPRGVPEITVVRIQIAPGAQLPLHRHPVINAGMLISGELTVVTDEGKTLHLKAGQGIVEVVNRWHYGKNEGTVPSDIIVVYAGVQRGPITINKD